MRLSIVLLAILASTACSSVKHAAEQDPMKCERDPKCEKKKARGNDCTTQCNDDPACVERCEQVQQQNGGARLGH